MEVERSKCGTRLIIIELVFTAPKKQKIDISLSWFFVRFGRMICREYFNRIVNMKDQN